jgi:hypothetical protein
MDGETDIGKALEDEKKREEEKTEEIKKSNDDNHSEDTNKEKSVDNSEDKEELKISIPEETSSEENSNDAKSVLIMIGVIIAIFALFLGGFKLYNTFFVDEVIDIDQVHLDNLEGNLDEKEGYVYNGYSFVSIDGLWWTEMIRGDTKLKVPLHFGPREVKNVSVFGSLSGEFNDGEEVFITLDPKTQNKYYTLAISELSFNVVKGLKRKPIGSCTEESYSCQGRKIISCDNNTENKPVIELVLDNQTSIELQGTCIKLKGQEYDIVRAVDRLLYQWYGIMD